MHGLKPREGMIMAVSLQTYLARVGSELFWSEFDDFSKWASETFKATVMPFLTPFPKNIPAKCLVRFQQMLTELRARWKGDFVGGLNWQYGLWEPLANVMKLNEVGEAPADVPPIVLKHFGNRVVECEQSVYLGFEGDFSNGTPGVLEREFVSKLLDFIVKTAPPSFGIVKPAISALDGGFRGVGGGVINRDRPTTYLFGTSILREVAPIASELCDKNGVNIVQACAGGSVSKAFERHPIPSVKVKGDTLVLHCLGNPSLSMVRFDKCEEEKYHPVKPVLLDDNGVDNVISYLMDTLEWVRREFKGRLIVVGPMPRYLAECCSNPDHHFVNHPVFETTLEYFNMLNAFIAQNHNLRSSFDFEFASYGDIFSEPFNASFLKDNVHLNTSCNQEYAVFISNLDSWKQKPYKTLLASKSFLTWSEATFDQFARSNAGRDTFDTFLDETTRSSSKKL